MSFSDVIDLHTQILTRIGREYVKTWGWNDWNGNEPPTEGIRKLYQDLRDGGYYALSYLEDDDEWYDFETKDDLTYE